MAIDPICGMQVDPATARYSLIHSGETIYFCARSCQSTYAQRHGLFLPSLAPVSGGDLLQIHWGPSKGSSGASLSGSSPHDSGQESCCGTAALEPQASCCHGAGELAPRTITSAYFCPCCPTVESDEPGDCPHCGMPLQPNPASSEAGEYVCPMHPEIRRGEPGSCPICGMDLERVRLLDDDMGERAMALRLAVCSFFTVPLFAIAMGPMVGWSLPGFDHQAQGWLQLFLALPVVTWGAWPIWQRAARSIWFRSPNMFTLVALGTQAALGLSLVALIVPEWLPAWADRTHGGWYFESAAVIITLVLLGQWLEIRARHRVQSALRELMSLRPTHATLVAGSSEQRVPLEKLRVGQRVRVKPGEAVPVDGSIIEGASHLNESMITGEPLPVSKHPGASVIGGTLNGEGALLIEVRATTRDSLLARIVNAVAAAQRSRAPIQQLADQVASYFVPAVIVIAGVAALAWWFWGPAEQAFASGALAAISVLLIACPCALGLATPVSIMVGVGRAAQDGILIKQGAALQRLASVDAIVFDKTGTLTSGTATLEHILPLSSSSNSGEKLDQDQLLQMAAAVEQGSEHPLAASIVRAARERGLTPPSAERITIDAGAGVTGIVHGQTWRLGTARWLQQHGIQLDDKQAREVEQRTGTLVWISRDQTAVGVLQFSDRIKPEAHEAIRKLKQLGCTIWMASGDRTSVVEQVANELQIENRAAQLQPIDKQQLIHRLQSQGRVVAMVGDGINDAPSLAAADVGIAMGTGTDVAIETADVSLVSGDPRSLFVAIGLARRVMTNIRQNLFFAFAYNALGIPIAAGVLYPWLGWTLSPMIAAAAMSFSSVSVIANALRLRHRH